MVTGWTYINGCWYYLNSSGAMVTGWTYINDCWYYLNSSGAMVTGWIYYNGYWYFMNSSGQMLTNQWISGVYYVKSDGRMAVSQWWIILVIMSVLMGFGYHNVVIEINPTKNKKGQFFTTDPFYPKNVRKTLIL